MCSWSWRRSFLACVLFGAFVLGGVGPATAYLKQVIFLEKLDAGFPTLLLDSDRPNYPEVAPLVKTPGELGAETGPSNPPATRPD